MKGRCNRNGLVVALIVVVLGFEECLSLNDEGLALLEFRSKVEVDPYSAFKNWNRNDHNPCSWSGVQCIDGKVASLNLKEQALRGTLAPELGKLSYLRSLILYKNNFSGDIPKEIGQLTMLELLDLRGNNFSGTVPTEIGKMISLGHLLLCEDNTQCPTPLNEKINRLTALKCEQNLSFSMVMETGCTNRKVKHCAQGSALQQLKKSYSFLIQFEGKFLRFLDMLPWLKFKDSLSHGHGEKKHGVNVVSSLEPYIEQNMHLTMDSARRRLLQESTNLPASPVSGSPSQEAAEVPATGSGSFPAVPKSNSGQSPVLPKSPISGSPSTSNDNASNSAVSKNGKYIFGVKKLYVAIAGVAIVLIFLAIGLWYRQQKSSPIGPWKTGISGPLQKAFVAGVPKLNRLELEAACEEFSNIINTYPNCTVFKGILSSGVEIAVVSTAVTSKDWSKRSDSHFRKKVDSLSRVNHKNFVNLLGYCEENNPFMRMIVFEYAPNGTLFDHLHVKEFEHLDWTSRMRIVMGTAYCLQYMHHELSPPVTVGELSSHSIYLTDDYAAKLCDRSMWKEIAERRKKYEDEDSDPSDSSPIDTGSNVYSFGILMLEIISGKSQYSEEGGSILNWATEYLNDKQNFKYLVDPSLKTFKENELEIVCEAIQECIHGDPKNKLDMKEITTKLKGELGITPEGACPSLSPLWWAELEILSVEAS